MNVAIFLAGFVVSYVLGAVTVYLATPEGAFDQGVARVAETSDEDPRWLRKSRVSEIPDEDPRK